MWESMRITKEFMGVCRTSFSHLFFKETKMSLFSPLQCMLIANQSLVRLQWLWIMRILHILYSPISFQPPFLWKKVKKKKMVKTRLTESIFVSRGRVSLSSSLPRLPSYCHEGSGCHSVGGSDELQYPLGGLESKMTIVLCCMSCAKIIYTSLTHPQILFF